MVAAASGGVLVVVATAYWWPTFGPLGRTAGLITVLVAFGAIIALLVAMIRRILLPLVRLRRDNTF
jgi:hypothetical protein